MKPTEPGPYVDRLGNVWRLWRDGLFRMLSFPTGVAALPDPADYAPFHRLMTEAEWEQSA